MVAITREDRVCARAMGRAAVEFVRNGAKVARDTNVSQCDRAPRDPEKDERWRRIVGMTEMQEPHMDEAERRAGIAALFEKIKERYLTAPIAKARAWMPENELEFWPEGALPAGFGRGGEEGGEEGEESAGSGGVGRVGMLGSAVAVTVEETARGAGRPHYDEEWVCEVQSRSLIVRVCRDFNITLPKLNALAREYRGITAAEILDGMRLDALNGALAELLKKYANELWLTPGLYTNVMISEQKLRVYSSGTDAVGKSEFFVDPDAEWRKAEIYETRAERRAALIGAFDAGWKRGHESKDAFAVALGFRSFAELNRATLNVRGKTVRQIANRIARDIVEFYLAAEVKTLRELACCDSSSHTVMKARYLYGGSCRKPATPFCDYWETNDPGWLAKMDGWLK